MAKFTYTPSSGTNRDKLRLILGDTNADDFIFEDSELDLLLSMESNSLNMAAATACRAIATNRAKQALIVRILDVSVDKTNLPKLFLDLAEKFEANEVGEVFEFLDSFAYQISDEGEDLSEYVRDEEN